VQPFSNNWWPSKIFVKNSEKKKKFEKPAQPAQPAQNLDSEDTLTISGTTCDKCLNFRCASCVHPNPQAVPPTAVHPATCKSFKLKTVNADQPKIEEQEPPVQSKKEQESIQDMPRNIPVKPDEYEAAADLGLIPCPYCKSQGRKMFFATDFDLRAHISTFHEPQSYTR
jgi:hypothetical protein